MPPIHFHEADKETGGDNKELYSFDFNSYVKHITGSFCGTFDVFRE
jgi:hypothetical protein